MEKIDIDLIMRSCTQSIKLKAFDWIKPPKNIREQIQKEKQMYYNRIEICKVCPIFNNGICDSSKSTSIGNISYNGCGCIITCKAALEENRCPANKW
jgi:hypothetical protein